MNSSVGVDSGRLGSGMCEVSRCIWTGVGEPTDYDRTIGYTKDCVILEVNIFYGTI